WQARPAQRRKCMHPNSVFDLMTNDRSGFSGRNAGESPVTLRVGEPVSNNKLDLLVDWKVGGLFQPAAECMCAFAFGGGSGGRGENPFEDRKSTRLNSSH